MFRCLVFASLVLFPLHLSAQSVVEQFDAIVDESGVSGEIRKQAKAVSRDLADLHNTLVEEIKSKETQFELNAGERLVAFQASLKSAMRSAAKNIELDDAVAIRALGNRMDDLSITRDKLSIPRGMVGRWSGKYLKPIDTRLGFTIDQTGKVVFDGKSESVRIVKKQGRFIIPFSPEKTGQYVTLEISNSGKRLVVMSWSKGFALDGPPNHSAYLAHPVKK